MITCPVCGTSNDDLATTCVTCRGFVQAKVDTLNLFETMWRLMESPRRAFRQIVLARHKNYVLLLSSLLGVCVVFAFVWFRSLGAYFPNLFALLGLGLVAGPPVGIVFVLVASYLLQILARPLGGRGTARNMFSVIAYASIPVILTLGLVFPVEMAVFGQDFFGRNPPPLVINPVAYIVLLSLDGLAVVWSAFLLSEGITVGSGVVRSRSLVLTGVAIALAGAIFMLMTVFW